MKTVVLVGLTGSGKSSLGNFLLEKDAFATSDSAHSETKETVVESESQLCVVDTPGYLDTTGRDAVHLSAMVDKVKSLENVWCFVLVVNFWNPRFDSNLKQMLRVFYSMFKHANMWDNFAICFTRTNSDVPSDKRSKKQQDFAKEIRVFVEAMGATMACNPYCFFVDIDPDANDVDAASAKEKVFFLGYLASLSPMSTSQLEDPGEYLREEEETQTVITERNSEPVFVTEPIMAQVALLGKANGLNVGIGNFSVGFGGGSKVVGYNTVKCGEAQRLAGHNVCEKGAVMKRTKCTWFDGRTVSYTPWQVVSEFSKAVAAGE